MDYRTQDFADVVRDMDVVLESVGGDYAERSLRALRPGGLLITLVERANSLLAQKTLAAGRRFAGLSVEPDQVGLERLSEWVESNRLDVHVDEVYSFQDVARAHRRLEGSIQGKLVLTPERRE